MIYTMLKTTFINTEPKLMKYRCYKTFSLDIFQDDLTGKLMNECNSYDDFDHIFSCQLDKNAPQIKNWIRGNTKPQVNAKLSSAIMKSPNLKNKANKTKSRNDIFSYKEHRNVVVKLNKKSKFEYFNKNDPTNIFRTNTVKLTQTLSLLKTVN